MAVSDVASLPHTSCAQGGEESSATEDYDSTFCIDTAKLKLINGRVPGVCGIYNHGNTCFAGSIVQCLANTGCFAEQLVTGRYKKDLVAVQQTREQSHGILEKLADLIESLWLCTYKPQRSVEFVEAVGRHAANFSSDKQNDAHEFLLWLLDTISNEFVGPARGKNSTEDMHVKSEEDVNNNASESDSSTADPVHVKNSGLDVLSRLFQGKFQSTLICPVCKQKSTTVEPYIFLPLHIAEVQRYAVYVTVIPYCLFDKLSSIVRVAILVTEYDTILELRKYVTELIGFKLEELIIVAVDANSGFGQALSDESKVLPLEDMSTLYAMQLPIDDVGSQPSSSFDSFSVVAINTVRIGDETKTFGVPFVVSVLALVTADELQATFVYALEKLLNNGALAEADRFETHSQLFRMKVINDKAEDLFVPEANDNIPFQEKFVQDSLTSAAESPVYIRMVLEWRDLVYQSWINKSAVKQLMHISEHPSFTKVKEMSFIPPSATLTDCLDFFTQNETLAASELWYCSKCRCYQPEAVKTVRLLDLPDVLIVQLKRFQQLDDTGSKVTSRVDYPVSGLNMRRYTAASEGEQCDDSDDKYIYDLYAVCNHYGGMVSGHYTAFCKNPVYGGWYCIDNDVVTAIESKEELVTQAAYLLFYERRRHGLPSTRTEMSLADWICAKADSDDDLCSDPNVSTTDDKKLRKRAGAATTRTRPTTTSHHLMSSSRSSPISGSSTHRREQPVTATRLSSATSVDRFKTFSDTHHRTNNDYPCGSSYLGSSVLSPADRHVRSVSGKISPYRENDYSPSSSSSRRLIGSYDQRSAVNDRTRTVRKPLTVVDELQVHGISPASRSTDFSSSSSRRVQSSSDSYYSTTTRTPSLYNPNQYSGSSTVGPVRRQNFDTELTAIRRGDDGKFACDTPPLVNSSVGRPLPAMRAEACTRSPKGNRTHTSGSNSPETSSKYGRTKAGSEPVRGSRSTGNFRPLPSRPGSTSPRALVRGKSMERGLQQY